MADDHRTVLLSILATLLAAAVIFVVTVAVNGGFSTPLFEAYVMPLVVTAFSLAVFAVILFAHSKGKIPGLSESKEDQGSTPRL